LSQAQSDYATLSQDISGSQTHSNNTINQDFSALGQALQSGSLSDAQNAFSTLQQDLQKFGLSANAVSSSSAAAQTPESNLNLTI
jgi:hypothetical protein